MTCHFPRKHISISRAKPLVVRLLAGVWLLCLAAAAGAETLRWDIRDNRAATVLSLPGGIEADFSLTFENVVGLDEQSLGLSVERIGLTDLSLLGRLPNTLLTTVAGAFPMMITLEPPADRGLSFTGPVQVEIHTHNLEYTAGTPLRLFKASLGGEFRDITVTTGAGSYRARGTTGKFSQFLIVADLRPAALVISGKFAGLEAELLSASGRIPAAVYQELAAQLGAARGAWEDGDGAGAQGHLNDWLETVERHRGTDIPDVWRSSRDLDNLAGELIARALSLRFSLRLQG